MASTTDLGKWMLTHGGEYNQETAYEHLTMVMYENSTYITLKTVQGITPTDDHINYQLMAKGFNPTALESVQAEDTSGVLGEVGGTVSAQDLINWVVDQAATKLLKISDLVSVQTNDATKGVSAALAYAMGQKLDQLNSNFLQAAICVVAAQDNTMTFTLKRPTGTDIRFTALVFLSNQSFNFIGAYAIGINRKTEVIAKIVGDTAATIKRIDDYTVTITFETYAIWSNGLAIIPKELL